MSKKIIQMKKNVSMSQIIAQMSKKQSSNEQKHYYILKKLSRFLNHLETDIKLSLPAGSAFVTDLQDSDKEYENAFPKYHFMKHNVYFVILTHFMVEFYYESAIKNEYKIKINLLKVRTK